MDSFLCYIIIMKNYKSSSLTPLQELLTIYSSFFVLGDDYVELHDLALLLLFILLIVILSFWPNGE